MKLRDTLGRVNLAGIDRIDRLLKRDMELAFGQETEVFASVLRFAESKLDDDDDEGRRPQRFEWFALTNTCLLRVEVQLSDSLLAKDSYMRFEAWPVRDVTHLTSSSRWVQRYKGSDEFIPCMDVSIHFSQASGLKPLRFPPPAEGQDQEDHLEFCHRLVSHLTQQGSDKRV